jgi:hypothetical protein
VANSVGYYNLGLQKGEHQLKISFVGYKPSIIQLNMQKDSSITFELIPMLLGEVNVLAKEEDIVHQTFSGKLYLPIKRLEQLPFFVGETDVIKAISNLPGVTGGREGLSDIYVRGGDNDQNLFLLDGTPVYGIHHAGGMVSVFNADALRSIDFYKGGFPAHFGGRISSISDIRLKEGNNLKMHKVLSIGLLSSRFEIDGPMKNKNNTYFLAFRTVYWEIINLKKNYLYRTNKPKLRAMSSDPELQEIYIPNYNFSDINAKFTHLFKDNSKVALSFFGGAIL